MVARKRLVGPVVSLAIAATTLSLYGGGYLARLDNAVADSRAVLLAHEADSDIVILGIDSESLRTLSEWPWPRRHHARLLQILNDAEPSRVFFDIDFSSRSNSADDALFEKALADWRGAPIVLATHVQSIDHGTGRVTTARPLEQFTRHAELASVMLKQSPDGLVRSVPSTWRIDGREIRSAFDHNALLDADADVRIDYSILPSSFVGVPYSQVLNGEIDPAVFRGKSIYVGATAVSLNDTVPVPVYQWLPGVVLQALAAETIDSGLLRSPPSWLYACAFVLWTCACWALFASHGWRRNLLSLVAGSAMLTGASFYLYSAMRIDFEIVAFLCAASLVFVARMLHLLDAQTWHALALAVGFRRRDALLKSVVESTTDAILCIDEQGIIRTANPATSQLFGSPAAVIGTRLDSFIPSLGDFSSIESLTGGLLERIARTAVRDVPVEVSISRIKLDDERLFTVILRDVSERREQQMKLEYQANHDALTGLPNRMALNAHVNSVLAAAAPGRHVALLLLDLGRFKEVNDTLGHGVGDQVLGEVADRFTTAVGSRGVVSRIGGDEFTVVLAEVADRATIDAVARSLIDSLIASIHVRGIAIEVGVSIGAALAPDHARDAQELLRNADIAMYSAKNRGSQFEYYDRNHDVHTVRRLSMMSELRSAIDNDQISLAYQPQVALQTRGVTSVEALARWSHPMLGEVSPDEFVTLAESTNLIKPLTEWTIRRAIEQVLAWQQQELDLRVAVNLSARLLQDVTFPQQLARTLADSAVDPSRIELEITESAMMLDPIRGMRVVKQLHSLGVLISIDDYGTGFSSLGYLRDLPAHALKLDKSFVANLETDESNRVIVESTVLMAHALGLQIVAEGVESDWVADYLTRAGYDLAQGYLFARAMPAQECADWVSRLNTTQRRRVG